MQGTINYEQFQDIDASFLTFDTLELKEKVEKPYILEDCRHPRECNPFSQALESWQRNKVIRCKICSKETNNLALVRKDIRWQAYQQFHQSVETVQIINGLLTHKYTRNKKKYIDLISKYSIDKRTQEQINEGQVFEGMPEFLVHLRKRFHMRNSISTLIQQQKTQNNITFWAYCLLDKVKITIPIRILKCDHLECYELTSLLAHYQLQQKKRLETNQTTEIIFECYHPGCNNTLNITTFQNMISGIIIDLDLLRVINQGLPAQFKFVYFPNTKKFDVEEIKTMNDPIIEKFYKNILSNTERQKMDYPNFQSQVQTLVCPIMQGEYPTAVEAKMQQEMYKTKTISMVDIITKDFIEFPVRCVKCPDLTKCMDVRSFAAFHLQAKSAMKLTNNCPLCQQEYKCQSVFQNIIYFDQNLISKMFKDLSYYQTKEFKYDGKQYMLDQFLYRQKSSKQKYIDDLQKVNGNQIGEFNIQKCIADPNKLIEIPLILTDCPDKQMIDFDTFYKEMEKCNFNSVYELKFCSCQICNRNPIKNYTQSIFYHEAYGEALQEFKKKYKVRLLSFKYNFQNHEIVLKMGQDAGSLDKKLREMAVLERGFIEMMGDEEYDDYFKPTQIQGRAFQVMRMEQDFLPGLHIVHDQRGIQANLEEQMQQMNNNANQTLKQFKFQVANIKVELDNGDIRQNVGNFCLKQ